MNSNKFQDSMADEPEDDVVREVVEEDDEEEEEEDEDFSGRRGRFVSERRVDQVIPKSSAPRDNIPDSLGKFHVDSQSRAAGS